MNPLLAVAAMWVPLVLLFFALGYATEFSWKPQRKRKTIRQEDGKPLMYEDDL